MLSAAERRFGKGYETESRELLLIHGEMRFKRVEEIEVLLNFPR